MILMWLTLLDHPFGWLCAVIAVGVRHGWSASSAGGRRCWPTESDHYRQLSHCVSASSHESASSPSHPRDLRWKQKRV